MKLPGFAQPALSDREVLLHSMTRVASNRLTICEQIRFIYDTVFELPEGEVKRDLTDKLLVAFEMGKKMNSRLAHYKRLYKGSGHTGRNLLKLTHTKEREKIRIDRWKD